jgi:hypothetical protein
MSLGECCFAWPAMVAATLLGCGDAEHTLPAAPSSDHVPDAAVEPLPACSTEHLCPLPQEIGRQSYVQLNAIGDGNVELGSAMLAVQGALVPWSEASCCSGSAAAAGVAVLDSIKLDAGEASVTLTRSDAYEGARVAPLPAFVRGTELGGIDPLGSFDSVISVDLDTLSVGGATPIPLEGTAETPPAVVAVGNAVAALIGPAPRFVMVDALLSERLVEEELDPSTISHGLTLTATCAGLLGTWVEGDGSETVLRAAAFDRFGRRRSPIHRIEGTWVNPSAPSQVRTAIWDGKSVVVVAWGEVVELDIQGQVVSRTPVVSQPLAAFGTDEGFIVAGAELELIARDTGELLKSFGSVNGVSESIVTASIGAMPRYVYVATSSVFTRDLVPWARIDCTN